MCQYIKRVLFAFATLFVGVAAYAQVTTSSMSGVIADASGEPLVGATVVAVHTPSGTQYYAVTNNDGHYTINGMRSGGPYNVEISFIGMATEVHNDVNLQLGENFALNASLKNSELLDEVIVIASTSKFTTTKTGAATNITSSQINELPTISRSITDIAKLSPYANGMSFSGGDGRSTNFTVDGANFNNNFGLSDALPGGGNPISMDAIEEVQVVVAPYDVRQTNFIGGGVNAITKSGTNTVKATVYSYYYNNKMRGTKGYDGTDIKRAEEDQKNVYGFTLGGPIIKNKLFFFVNAESTVAPKSMNQWRGSVDGVADKANYISRTKISDLENVSKYLKENYGYDTGSWTSYPGSEDTQKILARIDWNINDNNRLALRYNYTKNAYWVGTNASSSNAASRHSGGRLSEYSMAYANSCYSQDKKVSSVSFDLNSRIGETMHNQLLATFTDIADVRGSSSAEFPFIDILDGTADNTGKIAPLISAGYELFTFNNGVYNRVLNVKDDFTLDLGSHHLLAGVSYEFQYANNAYMRNGTGYYRYKSLEDFYNQAAPETVCLTYGYNGNSNPTAQVTFNQYGAYLQDEWDVNKNFKLTYGTRFDLLTFNDKDIMTNNAIKALDYGGRHIDTGVWPKNHVMISPRVGFSWDVLGDNSLKLRGGAGLFTGRLPLVFFTNMPTNSNMIQNVSAITTTWDGKKSTPDPLLASFAGPIITDKGKLLDKMNSLDPEKFPKTIDPKDGVIGSEVDGVDPHFKMPMVAKVSLAADYQVPVDFPFTVTAEGIFNKTIYGVRLSNYNILPSDKWDIMLEGANEERLLYPENYKYNKTDAFMLVNTREGYGYTANITLNAQPVRNLNLMFAYTRTESKEITGMPGSAASSAYTSLYTVNGPEFATLQRSQYVVPDRIIASVAWTNHTKHGFDTHVSLMYEGQTSGGWSYIYDADINGDGSAYDLVYIPVSPDELNWASADDMQNFWNYVQQDKYLRSHRGEHAEAYSACAPWHHTFDLRIAQDFQFRIGKSVNKFQFSVDVLNFANMLNPKFGIPSTMAANSAKILHCTNAESLSSTVAPVYSFAGNSDHSWMKTNNIYNTWQIQLGLRYLFN